MVYLSSYHKKEIEGRSVSLIMCDELPNCPECENSPEADSFHDYRLRLRDTVVRHVKKDGGDEELYSIPRGECPVCNCIMRMMPDFMAPFKQYRTDDMSQYLCGKKDSGNSDNPSDSTIVYWQKWLEYNHSALLQFGIDEMRKEGIPENWIGTVLAEASRKGIRLKTGRKIKNRRDNG